MAQFQLAELIYAESIDNSAGAQFDLPLIILDTNPAVWTATMANGSVTPLSKFIAAQMQKTFTLVTYTNGLSVFKAIVSAQTVTSPATPAITAAIVSGVVTFSATIPAGYQGSFVWGTTPDFMGGFAFPGASASGGGGGTGVAFSETSIITASAAQGDGQTTVTSGMASPILPIVTGVGVTLAASFTVDSTSGAEFITRIVDAVGTVYGAVTMVIPAGGRLPVSLVGIDTTADSATSYDVTVEVVSAPGDSISVEDGTLAEPGGKFIATGAYT